VALVVELVVGVDDQAADAVAEEGRNVDVGGGGERGA